MGLAIPVFHGRACCCCCGGGKPVLRGDSADGLGSAIAEQGASSSSSPAPGSGPDGWRVLPLAGQRYRVPGPLYRALTRYVDSPVFVQSRCGQDRDCLNDDRVLPSLQVAENGALVWIRKANGRFVLILDWPGKSFIKRYEGAAGDVFEFTATSRDEVEMRAFQRSANSGRFGFTNL